METLPSDRQFSASCQPISRLDSRAQMTRKWSQKTGGNLGCSAWASIGGRSSAHCLRPPAQSPHGPRPSIHPPPRKSPLTQLFGGGDLFIARPKYVLSPGELSACRRGGPGSKRLKRHRLGNFPQCRATLLLQAIRDSSGTNCNDARNSVDLGGNCGQ